MGLFKKRAKQLRARSCGAVIVAAGTASRMGGIDKVMAPIGLEPMLMKSVRAFAENEFISEIIVVTREDLLPEVARLCQRYDKVRTVIVGGQTRSESVAIGLSMLAKETELAAIHDGARPLVTQKIITDTVLKAADTGAAAPAIPVKDTIKRAENGVIAETPDRSTLFAVQTPQVFDRDLLAGALYKAGQDGVELTDDCMAVERLGMNVHLTEGSEENIKITTPIDLVLAGAILEGRQTL